MFFVAIVHVGFRCNPQHRTTAFIDNALSRASQEGIRPEQLQGERISVLFDSRFTETERKAMRMTFSRFNQELGLVPRLQETSSPLVFDLFVVRSTQRMSPTDIGLYEHNTSFIRISPERIRSPNQLSAAFMHEVGHWLGMSHVCTGYESIRRNDCSVVGFGDAIMNPFINEFRIPSFTELDRLEFHRRRRLY